MYMFRTKDSAKSECLSLLFLTLIIAMGVAVIIIEKISGEDIDN